MTKIARSFAPLALLLAAVLLGSPAAAQFSDQATYVGTAGGTANAITLAVKNWSRNLPGVVVRFLPSARNTGAATVVVNGVGSPIALKKQTGAGLANLTGGEVDPAQIAEIAFDGTQWQLLAPAVTATSPGGYLTPCQVSSPSPASGCTVGMFFPTGNVTSATTLYYEPVAGNTVPIYNGGRFVNHPITEAQMTLILSATANLADHIYDVCVYSNDGVPAIGTMPGWSTWAAGSGARGAAAEITQLGGVWVNASAATVTNNNVGVAVAANRCTIVASILVDPINGQVTLHQAPGQSRRWGVWNFYNQQRVSLQVIDTNGGSQWTYNTNTLRVANGNSANVATPFVGLPGTQVTISALMRTNCESGVGITNYGCSAMTGIGWNTTAAFSGVVGYYSLSAAAVSSNITGGSNTISVGRYVLAAGLGAANAWPLEQTTSTSNANMRYGPGASGMLFEVSYRG